MNAFASILHRESEPPASVAELGSLDGLGAGEVDLWRVALDESSPEELAALSRLLTPDEMARAERFVHARDRRRYIVARGVLRTILGRYRGVAPESVRFDYGSHGKPALSGAHGSAKLYFNVAHSLHLGLIAVTTTGEVGIDLERMGKLDDWPQMAAATLGMRALVALEQAPAESRPRIFFEEWTKHEAAVKALGLGLGGRTEPLSRFFDQAVASPATDPLCPECCLVNFIPAPGFVGALALVGPVVTLTTRTWAAADFSSSLAFPQRGRRQRLSDFSRSELIFP